MNFYRITDRRVSHGDEDHSWSTTQLNLAVWRLKKETPCGWWIEYSSGFLYQIKWVSKTARKRYAYPSIDEAATSFRIRKERCIEILESRARIQREALSMLDSFVEKEKRAKSFPKPQNTP